jgi:chemotaxis protein methyltransferase CheR
MKDQISGITKYYEMQMKDADFRQLSTFINSELGIKMPPAKKVMLQSRLQKRLNELKSSSFREYIDFIFSDEGRNELINVLDIVTTNKTDFFREPLHFDYLTEKALPEFAACNSRSVLRVWSAGCSTGEEPYTLAMVLSEFREKNRDFDFHITASDISTRVLRKAAEAIYNEDRVNSMSITLKKKYLLKSKNHIKRTVRIVPELRSKVRFIQMNFMEGSYVTDTLFDIIFCRNVLIYFDRKTQEEVINKLCNRLKPGGYFFLGHSESITNFDVPLKQLQSTIFRKKIET